MDFLGVPLPYPALSLLAVGVPGRTTCLICDIERAVSGERDDGKGLRDGTILSTTLVPLTLTSLVPGLLSNLPPFLTVSVLTELCLSTVEEGIVPDRPLAKLGEAGRLVDGSGRLSGCVSTDAIARAIVDVPVPIDNAPGLGAVTEAPLEFEEGRVGRLVLRFGGGSNEKPGISDNCCHVLGLAIGELPLEEGVLLDGAGLPLLTEDDLVTEAETDWGCAWGTTGRRRGVVGRDGTLPLVVIKDDTMLLSPILDAETIVGLLDGVVGRDRGGGAGLDLVGVVGRDAGAEATLGLLVGVVGRDTGFEKLVGLFVGVVGRDVGREPGVRGVRLLVILVALLVINDGPPATPLVDLCKPLRPLLMAGSGRIERRAPLDASFLMIGSDFELDSRDVFIAARDRTKFGNTA